MIVIVGLGALGSHVLLFLRNLKYQFKLIDFDGVEAKNCMAQLHPKQSIGRGKAVSSQQTMLNLFGLKTTIVPHRLTDDNSEALLKGAALVIDCTDNLAARQVIARAAKKWDIPTLHGSLSAAGDFGRVMWTENFSADQESGTGATCEDGVALPFFAMAAALVAQEAQQFLKDGTKRSFHILPNTIIRVT